MKRYKDAFTPVPEETMARVEHTLRTLPRQEERTALPLRRRWAVTLAVALVLTLGGGAVAAERLGVLHYLFGSSGPTEEQQHLVQDVNTAYQANMATITVTDAVFDGRQLSMGLVFDTDRPTYAIPEGLWLNGTLVDDNDVSGHFYWVNQDEGQKQTTSGLTAIASEALTGQIEARLRVVLMQPKKGVKLFSQNDYSDDWKAMLDAAQQAAEDGYSPMDADADWFPVSLGVPYVPHFDTETDYPYSRRSLSLAETHNMDIEEVWLTFTVEGNEVYTGETIYLDVANNDDLPFTVVVRRAELTLVGSHFVLDIYPKEGGLENPVDLDRFVMNPFSFWEDRAKMLEFQSSAIGYGRGGWMVDEQGQTFFRMADETGPIPELPENVWLVFESRPGSYSLWQWAIELSPTDTPPAQEVPVAATAGIIEAVDMPFYFFNGDAVVENGALCCTATMSANEGQEATFEKLWRMWGIYDMSGNKLTMMTGSANYEEADAGPDVFVIEQQVALPDELPDAVYLVPMDIDTNEANWDYAILLPVGKE